MTGKAPREAETPFWRRKSLAEMTHAEWESLCDGCGKCCLIKLEDPESGEALPTDVACKLLHLGSCRCRNYKRRKALVPDCVELTPGNIGALGFMPSSCAYRLLAEGRDLPWWHPLVTGDPRSTHKAGISVRHRVVSETEVADADLEDHLVDWPK